MGCAKLQDVLAVATKDHYSDYQIKTGHDQALYSGSMIKSDHSLRPPSIEGKTVRHPTRRESQERFPAGTQLHKLAYGCVAFPYPVSLSEGDLPGHLTTPAL